MEHIVAHGRRDHLLTRDTIWSLHVTGLKLCGALETTNGCPDTMNASSEWSTAWNRHAEEPAQPLSFKAPHFGALQMRVEFEKETANDLPPVPEAWDATYVFTRAGFNHEVKVSK